MNWIFAAFLAIVATGGAYTRARMRPRSGRTQRGAIPGYAATDGAEFALDLPSPLERGVDWWPELVEEFHSPDRTRVVLRFGVRERVESSAIRDLASGAARAVAQRAHAHVVYVEAHANGRLRGVYLFAPDGRGWSGQDSATEAWYGGET